MQLRMGELVKVARSNSEIIHFAKKKEKVARKSSCYIRANGREESVDKFIVMNE